MRTLQLRQLIGIHDEEGSAYISIHRTVQWNVLYIISRDKDNRWEAFNHAFTLIKEGTPTVSPLQIPEPEHWPAFQKYVPQILQLRMHCIWPEPPVELPINFAKILSDMGIYMWQVGILTDGSAALHTAIDILDNHKVSRMDPLRGDIAAILKTLTRWVGVSQIERCIQHGKEELIIRKAEYEGLKMDEKLTRTDEIRRYNAENDYALVLLELEDFETVESMIEECFKQYQLWGTEDEIPFEYHKYFDEIAFVRMSQGKVKEALGHCHHAMNLIQKFVGEEQLGISGLLTHLALLTYHSGDVRGALDFNEKALKLRKEHRGDYNHYTLDSYALSGAFMMLCGDYEKAE